MDFFPGIEEREGVEGVPVDLKVVVVAVAESGVLAMLWADSKRRWRRRSSSICCWVRRWRRNFSALGLFHLEKRISVVVVVVVVGIGAKIGNGNTVFNAISFRLIYV